MAANGRKCEDCDNWAWDGTGQAPVDAPCHRFPPRLFELEVKRLVDASVIGTLAGAALSSSPYFFSVTASDWWCEGFKPRVQANGGTPL